MKKRILALVLCIVMVLSITVITSAEDTDVPADAAMPVDTEETPATPVCTCGTEDETHAEDCPMYVAPAEPEIPEEEEPVEDSLQENSGLFEQLMACEDFDTLSIMLESLTDEEYNSLTEEQLIQVYDRKDALEPEPLPAVVLNDTEDFIVPSIVVRETVNFTNVAPLCSTSEDN